MKKSIIILLLFLCIIGIYGDEINKVIFAEDPWPPYTFENANGEAPPSGIAIKLINEIFKRLNIEVENRLYPWNRVLYLAKNGQIDGIMLLTKTKEREKYLIYSDILFEDYDLFWYSSVAFENKWGKRFQWNTFEDLKPYTIGTVLGYGYTEEFYKAVSEYKLKVVNVPTPLSLFMNLSYGRIDIVPSGKIEATYIINNHDKLKGVIISAEKPFRSESLKFYLAFSKKSEAIVLLPKVNSIINELKDTGYIDSLLFDETNFYNSSTLFPLEKEQP